MGVEWCSEADRLIGAQWGVSDLGLGCGNPVAFANIEAGETVLDLGAGAGFDAFLAASKTGPTGVVIGVDMASAMVQRARASKVAAGKSATHVCFRLGELEFLPVADSSVDVVVSNCVINLSPDKPQVMREVLRVLRPGACLFNCVASSHATKTSSHLVDALFLGHTTKHSCPHNRWAAGLERRRGYRRYPGVLENGPSVGLLSGGCACTDEYARHARRCWLRRRRGGGQDVVCRVHLRVAPGLR